ncbi:hypothetical protein BN1708_018597, partial [Verticillium longisporum]
QSVALAPAGAALPIPGPSEGRRQTGPVHSAPSGLLSAGLLPFLIFKSPRPFPRKPELIALLDCTPLKPASPPSNDSHASPIVKSIHSAAHRGARPVMMKEYLDSDRVNYLVWRYLLEGNYRETAAKFQKEWHAEPHRHFDFARHIKSHAL